MRCTSLALLLLGALVAMGLLLTTTTSALAAPFTVAHWKLESRPAPTDLPLEGAGEIVATASNIGDAEVKGEDEKVTLTDVLPVGLEVTGIVGNSKGTPRSEANGIAHLSCPKVDTPPAPIVCTFNGSLAEYEQIEIHIAVKTTHEHDAELQGVENQVAVEGGETPKETLSRPLAFSDQPTEFGVEAYEFTPENEKFEVDREAGSHPFQLTTTFSLNETFEPDPPASGLVPSAPALERNLNFKLPPGLIGNANVVGNENAPQQCPDVEFAALDEKGINSCPEDTVVGVAIATYNDPIALHYETTAVPIFNLVPAPGEPARFGFEPAHVPVILDTSVRTGEDYGATVSVRNASEAVQVLSSTVTFWGVPDDPRHNGARGWKCIGEEAYASVVGRCEKLHVPKPAPFLVLPTKCGPLVTGVEGTAWNQRELEAEHKQFGFSHEYITPFALEGCLGLPFGEPPNEPSVNVQPDSEHASTPSGLTVNVNVPQQGLLEAEGKAEADIEETELTLPPGLQPNPSSAGGLTACSAAQLGFNEPTNGGFQSGLPESAQLENDDFSATLPSQSEALPEPPCLSSSKIGTVSIKTPVLEKELTGSVYLAEQDTNPFKSPLVLYIVAEEEHSKVLVKLAGETRIGPTGQLTSDFKDTPESPFETLTLHLFNTERATQSTPAFCGSYHATAKFVTSAGFTKEGVKSSPEFNITSGPGGSPCPGATLPFTPSLNVGPTNSQAGALSPFTLTIGHADGQQALEKITTTLPPGAAALISQVTPCSEAQAEANECPETSLVGHTTSIAGLGGKPVVLGGRLYLTGELHANAKHGAGPFGLLAVTNINVGPFHFKEEVKVFSTININETTTAATVTSAPIPQFVEGVPSQLKQLNVTVERPGNQPFEFNPTNCGEELKITGEVSGYEGGKQGISEHFPVTGCSSLPFTPKLTASAKAQGSKENGTEFKVTIESAGLGQANIHKVDLTIPALLPSRLSTIQKACLAATFEANPASCAEGSVIGEGIVSTPVFKNPLRGPAYLVSHGSAEFPDVEFVLQGEGVKVLLDGKTDIKNKVTYSRFESSPDAPFTKFESIFPEGPHSALTPNVPEDEHYNLCKQTLNVPTEITGQNGAFISQDTPVTLVGCGEVKSLKVTKLTRAQLLAKALKACRTKHKKNKHKRQACEKQAHKKYGAKAKKSAKAHHASAKRK
jgi:hypothetical protein